MSQATDPVAIVGGGFLGSALATALRPPVLVTTRSGSWRGGSPPPGVTVARLDITATSLDPTPLNAARSLVIAVATGGDQDRRALWVEGVTRLLQSTRHHRWARVVFIGSTSALPDRDAWMFEDETGWPEHERGAVQRQAEAAVSEHCEAEGIPWWVLRLGGLYGPGRELGSIYRRRSEAPLPGDGHVPTNLIHRDDAVAAVAAALHAPPELGGIVHVVDDDHSTRRVMYAAMAAARGEVAPRWERDVEPAHPPVGKRVGNLRLKTTLKVRLLHPTHTPQ